MTSALAVALAASLRAPAVPPPEVKVDAAQVEYDAKRQKIVFQGAPLVRLTRQDATLTCRRLEAENDEQGRMRRAICTGDVTVSRGDRIATCDAAVYESASSRVVCTGSPVLRDGRSVLRGESLIYDLAEDRLVLTQAKGTVVARPDEGAGRSRAGEAP